MRLVTLAFALVTFSSVVVINCGSTATRKSTRGEGGAGGEANGGQGAAPVQEAGGKGGTPSEPSAGAAGRSAGAGGVDAGGTGGLGGAAGAMGGVGDAGAAGTAGEAGAAGSGGEAGAATQPVVAPGQVFNTGVDANGAALAGGSVDPHYTLIQSADNSLPGPNAIVTSQIADGYWVAQSETSKWIAPSQNQSYPATPTPCNASGDYVYRTTFTLTDAQLSTFQLDGRWGADNYGTDILLNSVSLGLPTVGYSPLTAFTISSGFVVGVNALDFRVNDVGCPNGLRVELTAGTKPINP